jgi:hypothetical protein
MLIGTGSVYLLSDRPFGEDHRPPQLDLDGFSKLLCSGW